MCSILIFSLKYFQKCIDPGFLDFGLELVIHQTLSMPFCLQALLIVFARISSKGLNCFLVLKSSNTKQMHIGATKSLQKCKIQIMCMFNTKKIGN